MLNWLFRRRRDAELRVAAAIAEQELHELGWLMLEQPDRKPYPLVLRYEEDQKLLAVYHRALRSYAKARKNPPRYLRQIVESKCATG